MPGGTGLKLFQRKGNPAWYVRGTVRGQSLYESTGTTDRSQAEAFRALREAELWQNSVFGVRATVTYAHALQSFLKARNPAANDRKFHRALLLHFKAASLAAINQAALDRAYEALLPPGASNANKLRAVLAPLRAVLNHAAARQWCDVPKFEIPAQNPSRVAYLTPAQVLAQAHACAAHFRPLYWFLVLTGARVSEALELAWEDVDLWGARVTFRNTKNGHERHHNLVPAAVAALSAIAPEAARRGPVFLTPAVITTSGKIIRPAQPYCNNGRTAGGQIKTAFLGSARRAGLPGRFISYSHATSKKPARRWACDFHPHDLRHTWATWHYCVHKDLLKTRNDGGWRSTAQVEIYAHLMPDAYRDQITAILAGAPADSVRREA